MSVTVADVKHIAELARLGLDEDRVGVIVEQLNTILDHMRVLQKVDTTGREPVAGVGASGMFLRADEGPQYPLLRERSEFAPAMRDGFFLVPRLATHEAQGEGALEAEAESLE
jgi:aspartyl-tRNA(Asn)/glutamyl-tRNA(Gln) amidotransferase subunit C